MPPEALEPLPKVIPPFEQSGVSGQLNAPELVFNWALVMRQVMRAVCLVEAPSTSVTGFLVAPDLVLTALVTVPAPEDWRKVQARFDYRHTPTGALGVPIIYPVAEAVVARPGGYVLLRLAGSAGSDLVLAADTAPRGWLSLVGAPVRPGQRFFMLHHALAGPQALDFAGVGGGPENLFLTTLASEAAPGAAGAPICDEYGRAVAVRIGTLPASGSPRQLQVIWARDLLSEPAFAAALQAPLAAAQPAKSAEESKAERLRRTRENLINVFTFEELQGLVFDLGVPWDELAGETRSARVMSLVEYVDRRDMLDKLLLRAAELRPSFKWT